MKTAFPRLLVALAALALLVVGPLAAAEDVVDFSRFKGAYKGTVRLTAPGVAHAGSASVNFKPSKSNAKAQISYSAVISVNGETYTFETSISLNKEKAATATDVAVGLGNGTLYAGSGTHSEGKRSVRFSISNTDDTDDDTDEDEDTDDNNNLVLKGTGSVRDAGKKRKLHLVLSVVASGTTYVFTNDVTAKVPKSER
jgi:hypothetical protein